MANNNTNFWSKQNLKDYDGFLKGLIAEYRSQGLKLVAMSKSGDAAAGEALKQLRKKVSEIRILEGKVSRAMFGDYEALMDLSNHTKEKKINFLADLQIKPQTSTSLLKDYIIHIRHCSDYYLGQKESIERLKQNTSIPLRKKRCSEAIGIINTILGQLQGLLSTVKSGSADILSDLNAGTADTIAMIDYYNIVLSRQNIPHYHFYGISDDRMEDPFKEISRSKEDRISRTIADTQHHTYRGKPINCSCCGSFISSGIKYDSTNIVLCLNCHTKLYQKKEEGVSVRVIYTPMKG